MTSRSSFTRLAFTIFTMLPAMLLKHALLLLLLSNLHKCTASVDETSNVIINTTLGPVEGAPSTEKSCAAFYGLPYAAPPIKDLRFRPPQAKSPWTKPRPAFAKKYIGKSCLQVKGEWTTREPHAHTHTHTHAHTHTQINELKLARDSIDRILAIAFSTCHSG